MRQNRNIWDEFLRMQRQMDSIFENFLDRDIYKDNLLEGPKDNYRNALADVCETDKELIAQVELPGVDKNEIDLNITDDGIEVKVEKREEQKDKNYFRRSYSGFYRLIPLNKKIDPEKIKANFKNGVLELKMPKLQLSDKRKIEIE